MGLLQTPDDRDYHAQGDEISDSGPTRTGLKSENDVLCHIRGPESLQFDLNRHIAAENTKAQAYIIRLKYPGVLGSVIPETLSDH